MIDWDLNPTKIPKFLNGPIATADVVRWVHKQVTQTYANGKYLADFHVPIVRGDFNNMQLVMVGLIQQYAILLDPNMM
jgi:hypothetical protein